MTDRHAGYVVVLEDSVRDDEAKDTITALMQVKGVIAVTPVVRTVELEIATQRAKYDMSQKFWEFYKTLTDKA